MGFSVDQILPQDIYNALIAGGWRNIYNDDHVFGSDRNARFTDKLTYQSNSLIDRFIFNDDGQFFTGTGITAAESASFGQWHRANGYNFGFGYYPQNCNVGLTVQTIGTTPVGISIDNQGNPTGVAEGIRSRMFSTLASSNYGLHGIGRNGTFTAYGIFGEITGGGTIVSSDGVSAVRGASVSNLDEEQRGGDFFAMESSAAIIYTEDFIGGRSRSFGATNASSTSRSIGHIFSAVNGSEDIAILVPASLNDGIVVINADGISGNGNAQIEVTGNIETIGAGNGYIAQADDGNRVLMKLVNTGPGTYAWDSGTVL